MMLAMPPTNGEWALWVGALALVFIAICAALAVADIRSNRRGR